MGLPNWSFSKNIHSFSLPTPFPILSFPQPLGTLLICKIYVKNSTFYHSLFKKSTQATVLTFVLQLVEILCQSCFCVPVSYCDSYISVSPSRIHQQTRRNDHQKNSILLVLYHIKNRYIYPRCWVWNNDIRIMIF